jgi:sec-independent protein translocase protein TatA
VPSNNSDGHPFADLSRVIVLDTEFVRREGRIVRLVINDGPLPAPEPVPPAATPWAPPPAPPQGCLPALLDGLALLLIAAILAGHFLTAQETIILLIIGVLLFGRRLPEAGRSFGKGIVELKKGVKGLEDEFENTSTNPPAQAPTAIEQPRPPQRIIRGQEDEAPVPLTRRATVRYYSRMSPERVYPLLVMITRDLVAKAHKKHTDQRTSAAFAVAADVPVEIEPVLPGCDCHPPRVVTRLGQGDLTLTFRVVPRVLGKVDGAVVSIRQDHTSLAEVELGVKVVKRGWVVLSGLATFLLPGLSAVMKHFGLDFETQKDQGFNFYLAVAQLVFDQVSPYVLTALLGLTTLLLWWLTRPRTRDVFWDIEKVGPGESGRRDRAS